MRNCAAVQSKPFNIAQSLQEAVGLLQLVGGAAILVAAYLGSWSRARPVQE